MKLTRAPQSGTTNNPRPASRPTAPHDVPERIVAMLRPSSHARAGVAVRISARPADLTRTDSWPRPG